MNTPSGQTSYPSYVPGTKLYDEAVELDYIKGLISYEQAMALLEPQSGAGTRWWPTLSELGSAFNVAISGWAKISDIEFQKQLKEFQLEQAKYQLSLGMMGEPGTPSYGGLNLWTILAFGGVAALALFVLKK